MATNYPDALDSLTNPSAGDALTSPSHSAQHANANDAIEAIETELGTNPSGSESTVAARLTAIEAGTRMGTNSVGATQLADSAVDTAAIQDGAVTPVKMATSGRFTFPTGAANGFGFTSGASHLSGTGSPEGVVTAAPGSTWQQTDATTDVKGWIRWVKATGTGSTGWVVGPEADTGLRGTLGTTTAPGVTFSGAQGSWTVADYGKFTVNRVGNLVTLNYVFRNDSYSSGRSNIWLIPSGFRPREDYGAGGMFPAVVTNPGGATVGAVRTGVVNNYLTIEGPSPLTWASGYYLNGTVSWYTKDAWPSSLPMNAL